MADQPAGGNSSGQDQQQCPFCKAMIPADAVKCMHCAEWVDESRKPASSSSENPGGAPAGQPPVRPLIAASAGTPLPRPGGMGGSVPMVPGLQPERGSARFAAVTCVMYLVGVTSPIAVLVNIIGLITGPRRGCFLAMIVFFWILPIIALAVVLIMGESIGVPVVDEWLLEVREKVGLGD